MRLTLLFAMLLTSLCSCAGYTPPTVTPDRYPGSYSTRDVEVSWRIEETPESVVVQGVIRDKFNFYLRDLDLTATLLDSTGKKISRDAFHAFPGQIAPNEINPFTLTFPLNAGDQPARIKFFIRYNIIEEKYSDIPYFQSFEADLR